MAEQSVLHCRSGDCARIRAALAEHSADSAGDLCGYAADRQRDSARGSRSSRAADVSAATRATTAISISPGYRSWNAVAARSCSAQAVEFWYRGGDPHGRGGATLVGLV